MPTERVEQVELVGGPFDGLVVVVSQGEGSLLLRDGSRLQRYDRGERVVGRAVQKVFAWTQEVVG